MEKMWIKRKSHPSSQSHSTQRGCVTKAVINVLLFPHRIGLSIHLSFLPASAILCTMHQHPKKTFQLLATLFSLHKTYRSWAFLGKSWLKNQSWFYLVWQTAGMVLTGNFRENEKEVPPKKKKNSVHSSLHVWDLLSWNQVAFACSSAVAGTSMSHLRRSWRVDTGIALLCSPCPAKHSADSYSCSAIAMGSGHDTADTLVCYTPTEFTGGHPRMESQLLYFKWHLLKKTLPP